MFPPGKANSAQLSCLLDFILEYTYSVISPSSLDDAQPVRPAIISFSVTCYGLGGLWHRPHGAFADLSSSHDYWA